MVELSINDIKLDAKASDKKNAIILAGKLLENNGYTESNYTESMLLREEISSTYIANGIAAPHGRLEDNEMVKKTGIVILQFPEGIKWDENNIAYIVLGFAAKLDEHLQVLSNLTSILQNNELIESLKTTNDPQLIIEAFAEQEETTNELSLDDFKTKFEVKIKSPLGLHIRSASLLVDFIKQKPAEIYIEYKGKIANGKSLMSILNLGVIENETVIIYVKGEDEENIANELKDFIENTLSTLPKELKADKLDKNIDPDSYNYISENFIKGIPVSHGIVIAPVFLFNRDTRAQKKAFVSVEKEWEVFKKAILDTRKELAALSLDTVKSLGEDIANIIKSQIHVLEDEILLRNVFDRIKKGKTVIDAWTETIDKKIKELNQSDSKYIAARQTDLEDLKARVIKNLSIDKKSTLKIVEEPSILITHDLFPTDTINLDKSEIVGFCTAYGGINSHTSLLARALSIPSLVACGEEVLKIENKEIAILDAIKGVLILNPSDEDINTAKSIHDKLKILKEKEFLDCLDPAITIDKKRIEILANIDSEGEVNKTLEYGAEGIGLLRTEFLYMNRDNPPSVDEQYLIYSKIAETLKGLPLTIRLLDVGGDKIIRYIETDIENNPFLGLRGIRFLLKHRDILDNQIEAIVKAATNYHIKLLIPMITLVEELEEFLLILNEIMKAKANIKLEIGIMIEVPSVAILADFFIDKVDFICIGTNDLTQYTLAVDRTDSKLSYMADYLHPSVLKLIEHVVKSAHNKGKPVCLCGLLASDIKAIPILIGLNIDQFSIEVGSIPSVKYIVRQLTYKDCKELAKTTLRCSSSEEVRNKLGETSG